MYTYIYVLKYICAYINIYIYGKIAQAVYFMGDCLNSWMSGENFLPVFGAKSDTYEYGSGERGVTVHEFRVIEKVTPTNMGVGKGVWQFTSFG